MKRTSDFISRRHFLHAASGASLTGAALLTSSCDSTRFHGSQTHPIQKNSVILFQGDSITDGGRDRDMSESNDAKAIGRGYVSIVMAELLARYPDKSLRIYNRGISGNKVFQLADRWQQDCIDLKPNLLSILIGVNDFWHTKTHDYKGTVETYHNDYRDLLQRTREALPDCQLIICEPFMLSCGAVDPSWPDEFKPYQQAARQLANQFGLMFIPYQSIFDNACEQVSAEFWTADGVHPTPAGGALMAKTWIDAVLSAS